MLGYAKKLREEAQAEAKGIIERANASFETIVAAAEKNAAEARAAAEKVMAEAEKTLADAKQEAEARIAVAKTREDAVAKAEAELAEKATAVAATTAGNEARAAELEAEAEALVTRQSETDAREAELQKRSARLDERSAALDEREADVVADERRRQLEREKIDVEREAVTLERIQNERDRDALERDRKATEREVPEYEEGAFDPDPELGHEAPEMAPPHAPELPEQTKKPADTHHSDLKAISVSEPTRPPGSGAALPDSIPDPRSSRFSPIDGGVIPTKTPPMVDRSQEVRIPNATVGQAIEINLREYHPKLEGATQVMIDPNDKVAKSFALDLSPDGILSGVPKEPGEFKIPIYAVVKGQKSDFLDLDLCLLVNPDPRSMWKDLPTDPEAPFQKSNEDHDHLLRQGFAFVGGSLRGRSHAHKGTFRDDDFVIRPLDDDWTLVAVSDGAGSSAYSREASRIICDTIAEELRGKWDDFTTALDEHLGGDLSKLDSAGHDFQAAVYTSPFGAAIQRATAELDAAVAATEGSTIRDFYATLLFAVVAPVGERSAAVVSFGLGDGALAVVHGERERVTLLNTPDGGDFAGQTVFCTPAKVSEPGLVWERLRYTFVADCRAVYAMTDGVSDPYFPSDADLEDVGAWGKLEDDLGEELFGEPAAAAAEALPAFLQFFRKGHHDDRTLVYGLRQNRQSPA